MSVESADPKLTYGVLWRAVPRHMGYLAPGVGLLILWVGFPLVMGALYLAKAFGSLEINRLAGAGARPIPRPTWPRSTGNFWHRFKSVAFSATYWRYALFSFIFMVITPFTWTVFLTGIVLILGLPTHALGLIFGFNGDQPGDILTRVFPDLPLSSITIDAAIYGLAFVIGLVTLPWILQGLVSLHRLMAAPP